MSAHLAVLGIAVKEQKKTERTIAELSLDLNLNFSLSKLLEGKDHDFEIAYGGDNTGINNIGNSCYINSVLQMLNSLPEVRHLYSQLGKAHMLGCKKIPSTCFYCQVSKIFYGLNSGKYSQKQLKTKMINN